MNALIQELAEQAAEKHGHTIKFTKEITETLDTFAELIVKECIDICNEEKADYTRHKKWAYGEEKDIYNEGEAACDTIKRIIKKRFGVV